MIKNDEAGLIRGIKRWDLVAFIINLIIGAGIFGLPSKVFQLTGSYSIFAYIGCSLLMGLIMLCFAEVSSRFSATGGPYLYALKAFGSFIGYEIGWLMWLSRVTVFATVLNLLVIYIAFFWQEASSARWRPVLITGFVLGLTIINLVGIRRSAFVNNFFAIGKLIPIILFVLLGLFFIEPQNFSFDKSPDSNSLSNAMMVLIFAFTGFEFSTINAGEVHDPRRNFPFSMFIVLMFVVVLYILIQVVYIGILPDLANSESPLADAAYSFAGPIGALIIILGAVFSMTGSLNAVMLGCTRIPYALAEQEQAPKILQGIHPRFKTPYILILISSVAILAFGVSVWLMSHSTIGEFIQLIIAIFIGFLLFIIYRSRRPTNASSDAKK